MKHKDVIFGLIAQVQRAGGVAAFVETEHTLDLDYAKELGVVVEELLVSRPDGEGEMADIVESMARSGVVDLIVTVPPAVEPWQMRSRHGYTLIFAREDDNG